LAVGAFVIIEGIRRLFEPPEVASTAMIVFGVVGLAGDLLSWTVLRRGERGNINMRAASLEVLNDVVGSVGLLLAAVVIATTGWQRADAVVSILIGLFIVPRTLRLLRETTEVLLEATPRGLDLDELVGGDECATEDEGQSCAVRAQSDCGVHEARTAL
jgi:cobalt-zinc-cadmium efflux system protein